MHSGSFCTGPKQREPEREEVVKMREAGVAEPAMKEWTWSMVFFSGEDVSLMSPSLCRLSLP